jgi:hypothetical protein
MEAGAAVERFPWWRRTKLDLERHTALDTTDSDYDAPDKLLAQFGIVHGRPFDYAALTMEKKMAMGLATIAENKCKSE